MDEKTKRLLGLVNQHNASAALDVWPESTDRAEFIGGAGGNDGGAIRKLDPSKIDHSTIMDINKPLPDQLPTNILELFSKLNDQTQNGVKYEAPPMSLWHNDRHGNVETPYSVQKEAELNIGQESGVKFGIGSLATQKERANKVAGTSPSSDELNSLGGMNVHTHPFNVDPSPADINISATDPNPNYEVDKEGINFYDANYPAGVKKRWNWQGKLTEDKTDAPGDFPFDPNIIDLFHGINSGKIKPEDLLDEKVKKIAKPHSKKAGQGLFMLGDNA